MPFQSEAQKRLMLARAHGWSPKNQRNKSLPSEAVAKKFVADSKVKKAMGGTAFESVVTPRRYAKGGGVRDPLSTPPRSGRGALGSLGSTVKLGGLGDASRPRGGLSKRPTASGRREAVTLSGRPATLPRGTSNVRPRAGRGSNAALALAGSNYHQVADKLEKIRTRTLT